MEAYRSFKYLVPEVIKLLKFEWSYSRQSCHFLNFFQITPILCEFHVKPSSEVGTIEVFHSDPYSDSEELTRVKSGKFFSS